MNTSTSDPFIFRPKAPLIKQQQGSLCHKTLAVKDLFHIAGWPTTAGNPDWLASHSLPDTTNSSVLKLMENGAQVIGKTITDEIAYSLNGQNIHYGTPVNPKAPDRLPGGSSSGSAVAVASNLADIGLGTDTGGSIRVPAAYNGIYGLRPTHSAIAMDNMVALAPSFDTIGWFTRDLGLLTEVATILLPSEVLSTSPTLKPFALLQETLANSSLNDQIRTWFADRDIPLAVKHLNCGDLLQYSQHFSVMQGVEIWQTHGDWITTTRPAFAPDIQARLQWCERITETQYEDSLAAQRQLSIALAPILDEFTIVLATTPGAAPKLDSLPAFLTDYRQQLLSLTCLAGLSGSPQLHLPVLNDSGAPAGFSLLGAKGEDGMLLSQAQRLVKEAI